MKILMVATETRDMTTIARELKCSPFGPHEVKFVAGANEALLELEYLGTEVVVLELDMSSRKPLAPLEQIRAAYAALPIVILVDRWENPLSLEALRLGAREVLSKDRLTGEAVSRAARYSLERMILDRELQDREAQYRQIVESAEEGIWTIDAHDRTIFVNPKMTELLGYSLEEMVGRTPLDFMDAESKAIAIPRLAAKRQGEIRRFDMRYRRKDGTALWTTIMTSPHFDERGRYQGSLALVTDIGDRKKNEDDLHRLAALVDSSVDAIISVDLEGKVLSWNHAAETFYGFTAAEAIGRSIRFIVPPDRQVEMDDILTRVRRGEPSPTYETIRRHKDGHLVSISAAVSPIRDADGRLVAASAIVREISGQQKLQEQFRQAQKMEAVGRLAGGVAHDFNNLLTVILGYTSLLLSQEAGRTAIRGELEEINRAGERAAGLTRQLLAFSRKQVLNPQVVGLNPMIKDLQKMLNRLIGEDIELSAILQEDLGKVKVDLGQMEQVVMNLAVNARDAMPRGGRLVIETRNVMIEKGSVESNPEIPPGAYVTLSVSDTGIGMDKEVQSHLFEPFYTTKGLGKGTGLGLSTIYGIVRQSGGHIVVQSEPGKGSSFKVYLPNTTSSTEAIPVIKPMMGSLRGTESIMLVEDNEMVRRLTTEVLAQKGYRIHSFARAEDALEAISADEAPDLLLTDMILPGMTGLALCKNAAQKKYGIKRLLMTGYTEETMFLEGVSKCGLPLLHKPFSPSDLLKAVRSALGNPASKSPAPASRPIG